MNEELRAAILMARAAALNAEVAGMQAENMQRVHRGESIAYDGKAFFDAIESNRLGENGITLTAGHGEF
jgi:hypothetical protein